MAAENEGSAVQHKWTVERIPRTLRPNKFVVGGAVNFFGEKPTTEERTEAARALRSVTLQSSSSLSNTISEEMLVECAIPPVLLEMADKVYIDDEMAVMVDKYDVPERETSPVDIEKFKKEYVPKMDESAKELMKQKFTCEDEAFLALCQMSRSFVPNLAAHVDWTYTGKNKHTICYCCSTLNHREKRREGDCDWHAKLEEQQDKDGSSFFRFTEIDSFGCHCSSNNHVHPTIMFIQQTCSFS